MKILLVDDSDTFRLSIVKRLSNFKNYDRLDEAKSYYDALFKIRDIAPDIVILDIRMPGGSGVDILKEIKKNYPSIKVIMMTNFPFSLYKNECIRAGADYFFDKITDFEKLFVTLQEIL
jgi:DNA-binding NarL/FixJ family response regulator